MMATSLNYNRKRQRLLSNGSSASNTTRPHLIPKKQHFSDSINTEIINLDSDDEDYVFNNRLDDYRGYHDLHDFHGYCGYRDYPHENTQNGSKRTGHRDDEAAGDEDSENNDNDIDVIDVGADVDGVRSSASSDMQFTRHDSANHFYSHQNTFSDTAAAADITAYSHMDDDQDADIFGDIGEDQFGEYAAHRDPDKIDADAVVGEDDDDNNTDVILQNFDYNDNLIDTNDHYHHLKNFDHDNPMKDVYDIDDAPGDSAYDGNKERDGEYDDGVPDEERYHDENESAVDDTTLDNGESYTKYFRNNHSQKNATRHLSFTSPLNNLVNRFLKKSNAPPSLSATTVSNTADIADTASSSKKRTKSLPQLAYAKMTYSPALDRDEISLKIGDVKASLINHYAANYTYDQNNNRRHNNLRKFSFNQSIKSTTSSNPSFSSTSKSSATSSYDEKYLAHSKNDLQYVNLNNHNSSDSGNNNNTGNSKSNNSSSVKEDEDQNCDDEDGYYIVKSGAPFANGRFVIKKLLGQGTFGKVVKAYDHQTNSFVAIKIIKSIRKYREASKIELRVLTMLKKHDPTNKFQCIHLRECFDYRDHICIVTDLLKVSLYDFMDKNQFLPFPGSHIQAMTKQLLRSVAFLHDLNLIHTDLKPENILIKDASYSKKPYHKLNDNETYFRKILKDPKIYTIDFGSAIFQDEYHSSIISTRHYRAPEIILGVGWSFPCDIWSIGCVLVELLTGDALFKTHENEQHLAMMEKVIGKPVDSKMVRQCLNLYKTDNRNNYSNNRFDTSIVSAFSRRTGKLRFPKPSTDHKLIQEVEQLKSIESLVEEKVGFKFDMNLSVRESLSQFKVSFKLKDDYIFWYYYIDLIKRMLVFCPDERTTAKDALNHKWFKLGIMDDGI